MYVEVHNFVNQFDYTESGTIYFVWIKTHYKQVLIFGGNSAQFYM